MKDVTEIGKELIRDRMEKKMEELNPSTKYTWRIFPQPEPEKKILNEIIIEATVAISVATIGYVFELSKSLLPSFNNGDLKKDISHDSNSEINFSSIKAVDFEYSQFVKNLGPKIEAYKNGSHLGYFKYVNAEKSRLLSELNDTIQDCFKNDELTFLDKLNCSLNAIKKTKSACKNITDRKWSNYSNKAAEILDESKKAIELLIQSVETINKNEPKTPNFSISNSPATLISNVGVFKNKSLEELSLPEQDNRSVIEEINQENLSRGINNSRN